MDSRSQSQPSPTSVPSPVTTSEPSAAFTPGPWRVVDDQPTLIRSARGLGVADTYSGTHPAHMASANARLIAAAPDLLRAATLLEAAEDFNANDCRECEGDGVPERCPVCFPLFDDARVARRAAIAKATGAAQ